MVTFHAAKRRGDPAAQPPEKAARTCKKLPVASFCASETAETGRIANGREQGDHVSRRQESFKVFCPTFCTLQKVGKRSRRRRRKKPRSGKGFNWVSAKFWFCALIRGLQNLESPFWKVLILFVRSHHCGELNRGLENLERFQKDLILLVGSCSFVR